MKKQKKVKAVNDVETSVILVPDSVAVPATEQENELQKKFNSLLGYVDAKTGIQYPQIQRLLNGMFSNVSRLNLANGTTIHNEGTELTAFARGFVTQSITALDDSALEIGCLWSFDTQVPMIRCFFGEVVYACTNLHVSNAKFAKEWNLKQFSTNAMNDFFGECLSKENEIIETLNRLKNEFISFENVGKYLETTYRENLKIGNTLICQGIANMTDPKSKYFVQGSDNVTFSKYHFLNSVTENCDKTGKDYLYAKKSVELIELLVK